MTSRYAADILDTARAFARRREEHWAASLVVALICVLAEELLPTPEPEVQTPARPLFPETTHEAQG
jgi:hypothetical protein